MELNFNRLENIFNEDKQVFNNTNKVDVRANESLTEPLQTSKSLTLLEKKQEPFNRAREVYGKYGQALNQSHNLRVEISKGLRQGQPIEQLLLKAIECISLITGERVFYNQAVDDLKVIYGKGLLNKEPLQIEIREAEKRVDMLNNSMKRDNLSSEDKKRLKTAIREHQAYINELKELVPK